MFNNHKHLIDISEYSDSELMTILQTAKAFSEVNERAIKKVPTLKGKTIVNMFNEPSTRTRSSFELAEKRLSADTLNFGGSSTSTVKGESLIDTVMTLDAYKIDCIVVRNQGTQNDGIASSIRKGIETSVTYPVTATGGSVSYDMSDFFR